MKEMNGKTVLGERLHSYRRANNLNQDEVAKILGISRNYVSMIERGKAENVSHKIACAITSLTSTIPETAKERSRKAIESLEYLRGVLHKNADLVCLVSEVLATLSLEPNQHQEISLLSDFVDGWRKRLESLV